MSEGVALEVKEFILPFSALSGNRKEPFGSDLEHAAIFALAELDRTKGGGLILKQTEEAVVFLAKVGYPLWLFPGADTAFMFDGLDRASYTLPYAEIPDVKAFLDNLKRSAKARETYMAFLSDHINYFQSPVTGKDLLVHGLISSPEFLAEFGSYRREATEIVDQPANVALLNTLIDEQTISSMMQELENLNASFKDDLKELYGCIKLLHRITSNFIKEVHSKAAVDKEELNVKIRRQEELIAPKLDLIKEEYDNQIVDLTKTFDKQHLPIQKEKMKLENAKQQALAKIERCKLEAKTHAENGDSVGEQKWKEKANETKKELSDIENQLKETEKTLKDFEERKSLEIFKLRSEMEAKIKEARQPLLELESSRDAKILIHKQEADKLENQGKLISDQIGRIAKLKETDIAQFEKLGVKRDIGSKYISLFYVPFYVACYRVETKKRYLIFPPSVANTIGLSTRLKGALGRTKIKELLASRFETIASLNDTIQVLIQQNAMFETEIKEMGERSNLLNVSAVREEIKKGLSYLKKEGWLSDKEYQALNQKIA
jgi:hypothetical protein